MFTFNLLFFLVGYDVCGCIHAHMFRLFYSFEPVGTFSWNFGYAILGYTDAFSLILYNQ